MENNNMNNERDNKVDVFKMLDEFMAKKKEQEELQAAYEEESEIELGYILQNIVMRDMQMKQARARRKEKIKKHIIICCIHNDVINYSRSNCISISIKS